MDLNEAKRILKNHGYIVKEGAFGDWAKRTFQGETKLGQAIKKMHEDDVYDKLSKHFAGLIASCMSRGAEKLKNDEYFVNELIRQSHRLADRFESASKSDDQYVNGVHSLYTLLASGFHKILEKLEDEYDVRININAKVFDSNVSYHECKELAKEYAKSEQKLFFV